MLKVVATDGLDKEAQDFLRSDSAIELTVNSATAPAELEAALSKADIAIIRSATNLNASVLGFLPQLKGVLRAGVGIDNIDLQSATQLGIWVWNAPTGNFQATAELALGLIFALARQIPQAAAAGHAGKWAKKELSAMGRQLSGNTLGIFGSGNIGLRLARMGAALGMKVVVCDPFYKESEFPVLGFADFLKSSDFISIHTPLLPDTKHVFNLSSFAQMKTTSFIVNCARGGIIKEDDLVKALEQKLIAGAALDVFEHEPFDPTQATYAKLLADSRVVTTPHMGASTKESQRLVGLETAEKIRALSLALGQRDAKAPKALNSPAKPRLALQFQ